MLHTYHYDLLKHVRIAKPGHRRDSCVVFGIQVIVK